MQITISIPNIVINISNTQNLNLEQMAQELDQDLNDLLAEVTRLKSLPAGVSAVFAAMQKKIADAIANNIPSSVTPAELANVQAKVREAIAEMKASDDAIAAAIVENTDAAPTDGGTTTPPVVPPVDTTPAPVDTTPAPTTGGDTTPPVDSTPTPDPVVDQPAPPVVDTPATPGIPDAPGTVPTAPTPVTNPDGSTTI